MDLRKLVAHRRRCLRDKGDEGSRPALQVQPPGAHAQHGPRRDFSERQEAGRNDDSGAAARDRDTRQDRRGGGRPLDGLPSASRGAVGLPHLRHTRRGARQQAAALELERRSRLQRHNNLRLLRDNVLRARARRERLASAAACGMGREPRLPRDKRILLPEGEPSRLRRVSETSRRLPDKTESRRFLCLLCRCAYARCFAASGGKAGSSPVSSKTM